MKTPLLPRGCTPVTLTVEEPRKFCVLFYLFHCTHIVDFTTRYQHEKLSCQWKAQRHKSGEALSTSHLCHLKSHRIKGMSIYRLSHCARSAPPNSGENWNFTTWSRHEMRKLVLDNWFPEIQKNLIRLGNSDHVVFDGSWELPWILGCLRWWWQEWIHTGLPLW